MAATQVEFTRYIVYYFSGTSPTMVPQEAEIDCFSDTGVRVGILFFYPDTAARPANENTISGLYLHYALSRFGDIMAMLKEEKPLYLHFDSATKLGYVATGFEPIGEQEGT
jgi:hypothetical protein